ncbi:MAG: hypothetical protein AAF743_08780, partial [Planctomycetota bacterium]
MRWLSLLLLPFVAAVEVEVGWSGAVKSGTWTPVLVSAVGEGAATVELYVPGEGPFGQRVRRAVVLTPGEQVFPMFARSDGPAGEVSVRVFGEDGRTLGFARAEVVREVVSPATLIGVGGPVPESLAALDEPFGTTAVGALRMMHLPREAGGYDGLDLLVLAGLDPADLPLAVKNAVADWVSGGGRLAVTLAPTPRLGDGRFDALLREPGRYGLGRVTVGETDWAALVGERAAAEVEAVEPLEPKPALPWLIAIALGVIGLVDFVLLRLVKHQPAGAVSVGLITVCLILVGFFSMVHVARPFEKKALVTQADDSIV